ncbi:MAG: sugar ABC transporter ATP-binding protein [Caldilineaceae bacterium]|nr:sugar ABC transporter ATP-binding protein [Caldilineaceae bacterium]
MSDVILSFENIEKSFFGVRVLKEITLGVPRGKVLGLVGENGAGKSTLMNLMGGVHAPDGGQMLLDSKPYAPRTPSDANDAGIAFIHQELNLFTNLSIAENIFIDGFPRMRWLPLLNRRHMRARTQQFLDAVELDVAPDTLVEKLSPGERQLAEIAKALSFDARIIIFDEPTTSLTARETERLFRLIDRLRSDGASIIYISHILPDVLRLADEIAVLRDGELVAHGQTSEFTINRMISLMVGRAIEQLYPERSAAPTATPVLEVQGVSQRGIVEAIDFTLHKGEILGVFGLMGSGRSELARILFGLDDHERGQISVAGKPYARPSARRSIDAGMAFVTENRRDEGLLMDISIAENIGLVALPHYAAASAGAVKEGRYYDQIGGVAESLAIKSGNIRQQAVKTLSGGNQQKTVIGKWLLDKPSVLIVDEPTRGVDVGAKYEIYSILNDLAADGAGILFISSELEELMGVCDRMLVMSNGEIQAVFDRSAFDKERILRAAFRENGS